MITPTRDWRFAVALTIGCLIAIPTWAFFKNPSADLKDLGFFMLAIFGPLIVGAAFILLLRRRTPDRPKD